MRLPEAERVLRGWDADGRYAWHVAELAAAFPHEPPRTIKASVRRLADAGLVRRAARGVYLTVGAESFDGWVADHVVAALRRDHVTYLSLESALSDYGAISQVPFCRTFMTTGRGGFVDVLDGQVELVHTARSVESILARTVETGRPIRLATLEAAYEDLVRAGRNLHLVDMNEARELQAFERDVFGRVA